MRYERYCDAAAFYRDVYDVLRQDEVQNTILLGNVVLGNEGGEAEGWRNTQNWYMAVVRDADGHVALTAMMTPPFKLTLYETGNNRSDAALSCLTEGLMREDVPVPGVITERDLAARFAAEYAKRTGARYHEDRNERIFKLETVNPAISQPGTLRAAIPADLYFLPYWYQAFAVDCGLGAPSIADTVPDVQRAVERGLLYILENDDSPVAIAARTKKLPGGWCVGQVYTPPYFRKRGYASSCVAQLSRKILDSGCAYAALFTDLANPISNSIYRKIGYRPVCDYDEMVFK